MTSTQLLEPQADQPTGSTIRDACYCGQCKLPLGAERVLGRRHAWCPHCSQVVVTSWFQVDGWTLGVTVLLYACVVFRLV